jgi:hypothetical protein
MNDEIVQASDTPVHSTIDERQALYFAGGAALVILGAGLLLTHPGLRKLAITTLSKAVPGLEGPFQHGLSGLLPDVERYMKIRSM